MSDTRQNYKGRCIGGPKDGEYVESAKPHIQAEHVQPPFDFLNQMAGRKVASSTVLYRFEPLARNYHARRFGIWIPHDMTISEGVDKLIRQYEPGGK